MSKPQLSTFCRRALWLSLVVALWAAACAAPTPTAAPPTAVPSPTPGGRGSGGALHLLYYQAPTTLNPHLTSGTKDQDVGRITYEPLASFDKQGNLILFLAAEVPTQENGGVAADGKSVTWKLKQGVRWSDGEPFTADDVLFTYQFITNPDVGALSTAYYSAIASVQVVDQYTVKLNFKDVNPAWALPFVGPQGVILPKHLFTDYNGKNANDAPANKLAVGTGPYYVVSFKPQEVLFLGTQLIETNKIVFEPNKYFREPDKPYFSQVEVRGGGTVEEAARLALQTGDVDYAWNLQLSADALDKLAAGGKGQVMYNFAATTERILINRTDPNKETADGERSSVQFPHPFLTDLRVRQAIAYAVDRDAIAAVYGKAAGVVNNTLVSPDIYNSPNTSYEYNLDKAAALLDEAGWKDTDGDGVREKDGMKLKMTFLSPLNAARQQAQKIVQVSLKKIGMDLEIKVVDSSIFFSSTPNPDRDASFYADLEQYRDGNFVPDPGIYMSRWQCNQIPQKANNWTGLNHERWCNPEYDKLYAQSTREMDPEKRQQLFIQMNDMVINEVVNIPLNRRARVSGVNNTMTGVEFSPWDSETWLIKDWRRATP